MKNIFRSRCDVIVGRGKLNGKRYRIIINCFPFYSSALFHPTVRKSSVPCPAIVLSLFHDIGHAQSVQYGLHDGRS
nr:MAG TPA: angiotensin-converting enzyme [Caudoviricetes sp.]